MAQLTTDSPFHAGEREAQRRAGADDVAQWAGGLIRDHLPEQHREFHTSLPFLVVSGADTAGLTWVTLVDGEDGFIRSPNARSLTLATQIDAQDPLADAFASGTDVGVVGIELATRRRNRFSGHLRKSDAGYTIDIRQTFGNCPQYIHERIIKRVLPERSVPAAKGTRLTSAQIDWIQNADTMFIGSGHQQGNNRPSNGFDASHRGGAPGFVHVASEQHLRIPDYAGNNFFNTIGNLGADPRIGLVFVDFETGSLLHVSGRATIDWCPQDAPDQDALRVIDVEIDAVVERPGAVPLRWAKQDHLLRQLKVTRRVKEAERITSFYLEAVDGKPLQPYVAGQHLPIELQIPGQVGTSKRSYSLSGTPDASSGYRLSIKREELGLVSRYFHDAVQKGRVIEASKPMGDFVLPADECPLVLVSAGVGITPLISMLHEATKVNETRPVWFVHGARNAKEHALRDEVDQLVANGPAVRKHTFYSQPDPGDAFDQQGRISADALLVLNAGPDAHYMLCGPSRFVSEIRSGLETNGVPTGNIHIETFGPTA